MLTFKEEKDPTEDFGFASRVADEINFLDVCIILKDILYSFNL